MNKKNIILVLGLLLFATSLLHAKLTPEDAWEKSLGGNFSFPFAGTSTYRDAVPSGVWTPRDGDMWWDTDNDILYAYDGTSSWDPLNATGGAEYLYLTPSAEPGTPAEGQFYYDSATDGLKYYNGTSFLTLGISDGGTLDEAYGDGQAITVDVGAVTLTTTDAANNPAMSIVHAETGAYPAFEVSNAGTDPTIEITTTGTGADITGTSATWSISKAGAVSAVVAGFTGDVTVTGTGANIVFDVSEDALIFADDAYASFGDAQDVSASWSGTYLLVEAATDNTGQIRLGSTNAIDLAIYGSTTSDIALFDASAGALLLDSYPIALGDGDALLFGDTLGTGDFTISDASDVLLINNVADGTGTAAFGASNAGIDVAFYGDAGGAVMLWDENANTNGALIFNVCDIEMGDSDFVQFGDGGDWYMQSGTAKTLDMIPGSTADGTAVLNIGGDAAGADLVLYGDTASHTVYWDASADEWIFGADDDGTDVTWHGDTASAEFMWDTSADRLLFAGGANISLNDDVELLIGTGTTGAGDFQIYGTSTPAMIISAIAANSQVIIGDGTVATDFKIDNITVASNDVWFDASADTANGIWYFGADATGVDVMMYGTTTAEGVVWDSSADSLTTTADLALFTMTGGTLPFHVNATATIGGVAAQIETTNGGIKLLADGSDNGDITLDAEDDIILTTTGALTITNTSPATVSGALTVAGKTTVVGINQPVVVVTTGTYTVLAANSGATHIIPDLAGNTAINLPTEAAGLFYKFIYCGAAAEGHTHTIDSEHNDNFFIGGVAFIDGDAGAGADELSIVHCDGNSNSELVLVTPDNGTVVELFCDGTNWYLTGTVISATTPTVADN